MGSVLDAMCSSQEKCSKCDWQPGSLAAQHCLRVTKGGTLLGGTSPLAPHPIYLSRYFKSAASVQPGRTGRTPRARAFLQGSNDVPFC